jgi:hypothetical protein
LQTVIAKPELYVGQILKGEPGRATSMISRSGFAARAIQSGGPF